MKPVDELNRLLGRGLTVGSASDVMEGKRDEEFEVVRAREKRSVCRWCKGRKDIPANLYARWDIRPERFYLAFDGDKPGDHDPNEFELIYMNVENVNSRLTYIASRDKDPWHKRYKRKTCGIAYRWVHNLPVTPPLIQEVQGQIHIVGGMHRYHLARHYGTVRMPFLVLKLELLKVKALLSTDIA